eukprot:scaffold1697_cov180-Amphora_coffeaeformis.AAC.15
MTDKTLSRWALLSFFLFDILALKRSNAAFVPGAVPQRTICSWKPKAPDHAFVSVRRASSSSSDNSPEQQQQQQVLQNLQDQLQCEALVKAKLGISDTLVPLQFQGTADLPTSRSRNNAQTCLILTPPSPQLSSLNDNDDTAAMGTTTVPALVVPLLAPVRLLLEAAHAGQALSRPVLWRLNTAAVNRDQGLFDNLPWSTWTADDKERKNFVDAAGNVIDAKFHVGKRDAYNVMMGKDYSRSSRSSSSRGLRGMARDLRERIMNKGNRVDKDENDNDDENNSILARRLLELQLREARMDLAECDYQIATARTMDESWTLEEEREILANRVASLETCWMAESQEASPQQSSSLVEQILADWDTREEAPYRGATGYAPRKGSDDDDDNAAFTSPYDMFRAVIKDQLKAEVIGAVLENTSFLEGTTALGGVLVLRRITARKSTTIAGQTLSLSDETEEYGNEGIVGGETIVVECDADEALGMSMACGVPLQVEQGIWERSSIMVQAKQQTSSNELIEWHTVDPELSLLVEGQAGNESATERVAPLRRPRSTTSLFDAVVRPQQATTNDLFPTDNPIQSLNELDRLTNEDRVRTLMSMSNFEGRLPRPRAVRQSEQSNGEMNALDRLLIPLIDESVRRDYYIRQAVQNGDLELAQQLESSKSMRQIAKEKAERAKEAGEPDVAEYWEKEADLYASLRADVTQDEGSYSRFLDRDEWYERERRKSAARVDRKKFGNLLDGIE